MKKGLMLVILGLLLVSVSMVSAGGIGACDTNNTIVKLSGPFNAHVAAPETTDYTYDICYSHIFGAAYSGALNPVWTCDGTNNILNLVDGSNSHADVTGNAAYPWEVCHGDLVCAYRDNACNDGEEMVLALSGDTNAHAVDPNYLRDDMIAWFKFDEDIVDSISGSPGSMNGAVNLVPSGKVGGTVELGNPGHISVVNNADFDISVGEDVTHEAWIKIDNWAGASKVIMGNGNPDIERIRTFVNDAGRVQLNINSTVGNNLGAANPAGKLVNDGNWHHVVASYDRDGDGVIYIDGVEDYRVDISGTNGEIMNSYFCVGASCFGPGGGNGFNDFIDEAIVYNRALSPDEILGRYTLGVYEKKICCSATPVVVPAVRWEDADGNVITEANLGDTVRMVQTLSASGDFEIIEVDGAIGGGNDEEIHVSPDHITGVVEDGDLVGVWEITLEDFEKGKPNEGSPADIDDGHLEAIFTVNGETSGFLNITPNYDDDEMIVTLMNPPCGTIYDQNDVSQIEINASDPDDTITGNVTVDGIVTSFSNGIVSFPHTWSTPGNVQVEVFAVNTRGFIRRTISSVMVVAPGVTADYVAACIDKPADFTDIDSSQVEFDASSSNGLECTTPVNAAACNPVDVTGLWFSWRFSDGLVNFNHDGAEPNGLAYKFFKNFATGGNNWAILDVEIQ